MTERSSYFHNVSLSWSWLISQQKILFVSVSNAPGFRNEFGRRYADAPDVNGFYQSELIRPKRTDSSLWASSGPSARINSLISWIRCNVRSSIQLWFIVHSVYYDIFRTYVFRY